MKKMAELIGKCPKIEGKLEYDALSISSEIIIPPSIIKEAEDQNQDPKDS